MYFIAVWSQRLQQNISHNERIATSIISAVQLSARNSVIRGRNATWKDYSISTIIYHALNNAYAPRRMH
jgi:hypothetical protein